MRAGNIHIGITTDTTKLQQGLKQAQSMTKKSTDAIANSFKRIKDSVLSVHGALLGLGAGMGLKALVNAASNLEEVTNKFDVVFKGQEASAARWTQNLVKNYAMSTREAREYLSAMQDLLVPMGMLPDQAAVLSNSIVRLSADLGSFNNQSTAKVMEDIQSAMVGNFETMKKYGVILTAANVSQKALNMGLAETTKQVSAGDKAMAAYNIILESSTAAVGDSDRSASSYANTMKRMKSNIENIAAVIGQRMLPSLAKFIEGANKMLKSSDFERWARAIGNAFSWVIERVVGLTRYISDLSKALGMVAGGSVNFKDMLSAASDPAALKRMVSGQDVTALLRPINAEIVQTMDMIKELEGRIKQRQTKIEGLQKWIETHDKGLGAKRLQITALERTTAADQQKVITGQRLINELIIKYNLVRKGAIKLGDEEATTVDGIAESQQDLTQIITELNKKYAGTADAAGDAMVAQKKLADSFWLPGPEVGYKEKQWWEWDETKVEEKASATADNISAALSGGFHAVQGEAASLGNFVAGMFNGLEQSAASTAQTIAASFAKDSLGMGAVGQGFVGGIAGGVAGMAISTIANEMFGGGRRSPYMAALEELTRELREVSRGLKGLTDFDAIEDRFDRIQDEINAGIRDKKDPSYSPELAFKQIMATLENAAVKIESRQALGADIDLALSRAADTDYQAEVRAIADRWGDALANAQKLDAALGDTNYTQRVQLQILTELDEATKAANVSTQDLGRSLTEMYAGLASSISGQVRGGWGLQQWQAEQSRLHDAMIALDANATDYHDNQLGLMSELYNVNLNIAELTETGTEAATSTAANTQALLISFDAARRSIDDMVLELTGGSMAPVQSKEFMQAEYDRLRGSIQQQGLSPEDAAQAVNQFNSFLPKYLSFMNAYGMDYATLVGQAITDLNLAKETLPADYYQYQSSGGGAVSIPGLKELSENGLKLNFDLDGTEAERSYPWLLALSEIINAFEAGKNTDTWLVKLVSDVADDDKILSDMINAIDDSTYALTPISVKLVASMMNETGLTWEGLKTMAEGNGVTVNTAFDGYITQGLKDAAKAHVIVMQVANLMATLAGAVTVPYPAGLISQVASIYDGSGSSITGGATTPTTIPSDAGGGDTGGAGWHTASEYMSAGPAEQTINLNVDGQVVATVVANQYRKRNPVLVQETRRAI